MRKPESSTPHQTATLNKPAPQKPQLSLVKEQSVSKLVAEINLGRRRVPRRSFDSPIGLLAAGSYEIERSFQVGEGGMMFSSRRKLIVGQMVVISFYLNAATIVVRGVIRSIIPAAKELPERYGVEFTNLGFQFKREIRNFVASATGADAKNQQ